MPSRVTPFFSLNGPAERLEGRRSNIWQLLSKLALVGAQDGRLKAR